MSCSAQPLGIAALAHSHSNSAAQKSHQPFAYSEFDWSSVTCEVEGTLDRKDRRLQFESYRVHAALEVPAGTDEARARRLLEKAEENCLITNSLNGVITLEPEVRVTR